MDNLTVYTTSGADSGKKVSLPSEVFGQEKNDHLLYLAVKHYLNNQRQGTHQSKERADIVGSTKKIKRQKGTGTARAGSIKNPLFRGGGRVFGPRPRVYGGQLNKKVSKKARCVALSDKMRADQVQLIEDFKLDAPKTKTMVEMLSKLDTPKKTLLVIPELDQNIVRSGRNIAKFKISRAADLNVFDIMNADRLLIAEGSIEKIKETLG